MSNSSRLLGKYQLLEELGCGGFATVYRARDPDLGREVALKVLDPLLTRDPVWVERFRREARAVARLRHPHIVTIYEIGEADGLLYIAMELIPGPGLKEVIGQRGRLSWEETMTILAHVADALDCAHGEGILHRDLKPGNILLDDRRGAVLTDFGFAKLVGESSMSVSTSGGVVGTPAYIAPEVWDGEATTPQTDLYALACIVYEMLMGEVLFAGDTPSVVMRKHLLDGPELQGDWPESVPTDMTEVLQKALAHESAERFADASELVTSIKELKRAEREREAAAWRAKAVEALAAGDRQQAREAARQWQALALEDPEAGNFLARLSTTGTEEPSRSALEEPNHLSSAPMMAQSEPAGEKLGRQVPGWLWAGGGIVMLFLLVAAVSTFFKPMPQVVIETVAVEVTRVVLEQGTAVTVVETVLIQAPTPSSEATATLDATATAASGQATETAQAWPTGTALAHSTATAETGMTATARFKATGTASAETAQAGATATAQAKLTATARPTSTRGPRLPTATATPRSYPIPVLLEPINGAEVARIPLTLRWHWSGVLGLNEYFRVSVGGCRQELGCANYCNGGLAYTKDLFWQAGQADIDFCHPCYDPTRGYECIIGTYSWRVEVIRQEYDQYGNLIEEQILAESEQGRFSWVGP